MAKWTRQQLEDHLNKKPKKRKKRSKEKEHIALILNQMKKEGYFKEVIEEKRFAAEFVGMGKGIRQRLKDANLQDWRFDWCIPEHMIAIEYEGIMQGKSRHTTLVGYTGDCRKYNVAQLLGWRVLRFTAISYTEIKDVLTKHIYRHGK